MHILPKKSETFTLHRILDDPRNISEDLSKTNDEDNNHLVAPGLSDWLLQNKEYKALISNLGLWEFDNDFILDTYLKWINPNDQDISEESKISQSMVNKSIEISNDFRREVIQKWKDGWSFRTLSAVFGISIIYCLQIVKEDKQEESSKFKLKIGKKLPYKITTENISHAREFMNKNFKIKKSVGLLKNYMDGIEGLQTLSKLGVYHLLTKIINFHTRKHILFQSKMIVKEKIREFMEAAYIQCYLDQHGFPVVYVDEFHVNINSSSLKN